MDTSAPASEQPTATPPPSEAQPTESAAPPIEEEVLLGIDFGSQKVVVASITNTTQFPKLVANELNNDSTPALVAFRGKEQFIGETAVGQMVVNAANTVTQVKLLLGQKWSDVAPAFEGKGPASEGTDGGVVFKVAYNEREGIEQAEFSPEEAAACLLRQAKSFADKQFGRSVTRCVLTYSGNSNDAQTQALVNAAALAELEVVHSIPETAAAVLTYAFTHGTDTPKKVLFIDMGQSFLGALLVEVDKSNVNVLAEVYDNTLGARSFDDEIVKKIGQAFQEKTKQPPNFNSKVRARVQQAAEKAKHILSTLPEAHIDVPSVTPDLDLHFVVSRAQINEACKSILDRVGELVEKVYTDAKVTPEEVEVVEAVGGGLRIPEVMATLQRVCKRELSRHLDSASAVAIGAALSGAVERGFIVGPKLPNICVTAPNWSPEKLKASIQRLEAMEAKNRENEATKAACNQLESLVFDTRAKLQQHKPAASEMEAIQKLLAQCEEWIAEADEDTHLSVYEQKIAELTENIRSASDSFHKYLQALEEQKKKEHLEALEAERELANKQPSEKKDRPKSNVEKIALAMKSKNQGNILFKEFDNVGAAAKYIEALSFFDQMWDVSEPQQKEVSDIKVGCYLNLAMCYLKLERPDKAIENCKLVLHIQPTNTKALYRKSQGNIAKKNWQEAKKDLLEAEKVEPDNQDVKKELARVQKQIELQAQREKQMYAKMFA